MSELQNAAKQQLRQFIESIERLQEEQKALGGDIKDKFLEAKGVGFDVKTMREVLRLRKKSSSERQEAEALLDTYLNALDMQGDMFRDAAPANDEPEATISLNGGPAHPISLVKEAVRLVRRDRGLETEAAE